MGRIAPTDNAYAKNAAMPRFLFFRNMLELPFQTLLQGAFFKKPLENPQKLSIKHPDSFWQKLLRFQRTAPTDNASKKKNVLKQDVFLFYEEDGKFAKSNIRASTATNMRSYFSLESISLTRRSTFFLKFTSFLVYSSSIYLLVIIKSAVERLLAIGIS